MSTDGAVFDELSSEGVTAEVSGLLESMAQAQRDNPGEEIGDAGGIKVKASKPRSLVRYNGVDLPPRTRVYDRKGFPSDVPTAQLFYHLGKKGPDGERVFFDKIPAGVVAPTPIDETCEWCEKRAGRRVKVFYDLDDYEAHCEYLHPREWASKLRRENQSENVSSVKGLLKLIAGLTPEQRANLVGEA